MKKSNSSNVLVRGTRLVVVVLYVSLSSLPVYKSWMNRSNITHVLFGSADYQSCTCQGCPIIFLGILARKFSTTMICFLVRMRQGRYNFPRVAKIKWRDSEGSRRVFFPSCDASILSMTYPLFEESLHEPAIQLGRRVISARIEILRRS